MNASVADTALQALTRRLGRALQAELALPAEPGPPLHLAPAPQPIAPALLARSHATPRARQDAQALYLRCLQHFRRQVQAAAPQDDAGLAAAHFVLACVAVLQGCTPAADDLARVERQLRRWLGSQPGWHDAPLRDRQSAFEQFAVLGVLVAETSAQAAGQGPAAVAHVQRAARGYLVQMLGVAADRLVLGPQGLALETATA